MGFFDKLLGKNKETFVPQKQTEEVQFVDWSTKRERAVLLAQMKEMLERNFSEYEIACEYPASMLNPNSHPACTPIQFMFRKDGRNVLAVAVVKQNTYRGMNVIGTQKLCDDMGIPYIRFFEEYPNKEEYVVSRVGRYL